MENNRSQHKSLNNTITLDVSDTGGVRLQGVFRYIHTGLSTDHGLLEFVK